MRGHRMAKQWIESTDQDKQKYQARNRVKRVDQSHHDRVGLTADVPRYHSVDDPYRKTDEGASDPDQQRDPGAEQNPVEKIAPIQIGSEEMLAGRGEKAITGDVSGARWQKIGSENGREGSNQ